MHPSLLERHLRMDRALATRNVAFALLGAGILVLKGRYDGPGQEYVVSYAGNLGVSFALYFAAASTTRRWVRPRLSAALAVLLAVTLFEVTDGFGVMANVFDPWDLAANVAGVGLAVATDALTTRVIGRFDRGGR